MVPPGGEDHNLDWFGNVDVMGNPGPGNPQAGLAVDSALSFIATGAAATGIEALTARAIYSAAGTIGQEIQSGVQIFVNSAGDASVYIEGNLLTYHASLQASLRNISLGDISATLLEGTSFTYMQAGKQITGYYNALQNLLVGVGDNITTVLNPRNPVNYLLNLINR